MHGGLEQQIPAQAEAITFGLPALSYVPTIQTGVGTAMVLAPKDFFTSVALNYYSIKMIYLFFGRNKKDLQRLLKSRQDAKSHLNKHLVTYRTRDANFFTITIIDGLF